MCISTRKKWGKFDPSPVYLRAVEGLTTVELLHLFIECFQYTGESGKDVWQTPEEFLRNFELDCDDFMRFTCDVLKRIMGIEAIGMVHSGYDIVKWGNQMCCHAITVFPFEGKLAVFSNDYLYIGIDSYEEAGHLTFKDGLKSWVLYDWQGKVLARRIKLIGTF